MVSVMSLWLPILLSAVFVFLASSVIHMVLTYHRSDFRPLPEEDRVMRVLREVGCEPGDYFFPYVASQEERKSEAFIEKMNRGPTGFLTIAPSGMTGMGKNLTQWFLLSLVVGVFAAYVAGRALSPGAEYLEVFRFAGTTAFLGYSLALVHDSIWFKRSWSMTAKYLADGLVYGLITAGTFGWLWPS